MSRAQQFLEEDKDSMIDQIGCTPGWRGQGDELKSSRSYKFPRDPSRRKQSKLLIIQVRSRLLREYKQLPKSFVES